MSTFSTSKRQKRLKTLGVLHFCLQNVLRATTVCTFSTSQLPKVVRGRQFLTLLTSKCASRRTGVHFFDIATSKSGPELRCFIHFDCEMCFAPQRRALYGHRNFQTWSGAEVLCAFWLRNVLSATTACTFSTSQLPKVVRPCCAFYLLTSKCASHHNGVQFFISHLACWLRTRRFSEPTFRPTGATNHWKNTVNRDFPTFSRICIFFLFSPLLFNCPYCRKFHVWTSFDQNDITRINALWSGTCYPWRSTWSMSRGTFTPHSNIQMSLFPDVKTLLWRLWQNSAFVDHGWE